MITKIFFVFGVLVLAIQTLNAAPAPAEEAVGTGNVLVAAAAAQNGDKVEQRPLNTYPRPLFDASGTTISTDANQKQQNTEVSVGLQNQNLPSVTTQMQGTAPLKGSFATTSTEQLLSSNESIEAMNWLPSLLNEFKKQEEFMNSILSQFAGSMMRLPGGGFPSLPSMGSSMPYLPKIDQSKMQLVDEQTINDENVKGKIQTFTSKSDPNINTVIRKGTYTTKNGNGIVHTMSSSSNSFNPSTGKATKSNSPAMLSGLRLPNFGFTPPSIQVY